MLHDVPDEYVAGNMIALFSTRYRATKDIHLLQLLAFIFLVSTILFSSSLCLTSSQSCRMQKMQTAARFSVEHLSDF